MRRIAALIFVMLLPLSAGCSYDTLFGACGTYYSAAYDRNERFEHYRSEVERWEDYHPDEPTLGLD